MLKAMIRIPLLQSNDAKRKRERKSMYATINNIIRPGNLCILNQILTIFEVLLPLLPQLRTKIMVTIFLHRPISDINNFVQQRVGKQTSPGQASIQMVKFSLDKLETIVKGQSAQLLDEILIFQLKGCKRLIFDYFYSRIEQNQIKLKDKGVQQQQKYRKLRLLQIFITLPSHNWSFSI